MVDPIGIGMSGLMGGINAYIGNLRNPENTRLGKPEDDKKLVAADEGDKNPTRNSTPTVNDEDADKKRRFDSYECKTCENRKYKDGSDDNGVSFQTPTKVAPEAAAAAVRGHEQEHVVRNQNKAKVEGKEVVSQSVTLHTGICEECGKVYISGGTTRTVTKNSSDNAEKFRVGMKNDREKGEALDMAV